MSEQPLALQLLVSAFNAVIMCVPISLDAITDRRLFIHARGI